MNGTLLPRNGQSISRNPPFFPRNPPVIPINPPSIPIIPPVISKIPPASNEPGLPLFARPRRKSDPARTHNSLRQLNLHVVLTTRSLRFTAAGCSSSHIPLLQFGDASLTYDTAPANTGIGDAGGGRRGGRQRRGAGSSVKHDLSEAGRQLFHLNNPRHNTRNRIAGELDRCHDQEPPLMSRFAAQ
jgi:hypothetical protein